MKAVSEWRRPSQQIIADELYPRRDGVPDPDKADRRHQAIMEVLRRLPEDAYQKVKKIKQSKRSFEWFLPEFGEWGLTYRFLPNVKPRTMEGRPISDARHGVSFLARHVRVVYLSPLLELRAWDSIVLTAAHELAHVVLNHAHHCGELESRKCEREVFRLLCRWGFEREARRAEEFCDRICAAKAPRAGRLAALMPLVRQAGIEAEESFEDDRPATACIEFPGSGDAEMFLNIARREYEVKVDQWDEGEEGSHAFRVKVLVSFSILDIPSLMTVFAEHSRHLVGGR